MPSPALLPTFLRVMSLVFFAAGAMHLTMGLSADVSLGAEVSATTLRDAGLDSQNRFYGTCFMLYGVVLLYAATDLTRYLPILRAALWLLIAAGLARLLSVWLYGWPSVMINVLLALELLLPPLVLIWLKTAGRLEDR